MKAEFNEQIFYFDGDNSSFLTGLEISQRGILLSTTPNIRLNEFKIEFSFPDSDYIIKAVSKINKLDQLYFLEFTEIDTLSISEIKKFIFRNSKHKTNKRQPLNTQII